MTFTPPTLPGKQRMFVPADLELGSWESIKPYFDKLENSEPANVEELKQWLMKRSELTAILQEEIAWRYIRMNCDTADKSYAEDFQLYVNEIEPKVSEIQDRLDRKLLDSEHLSGLDNQKYFVLLRAIKKRTEIFRKENIQVYSELQIEEQKYGKLMSELSIEHNNMELTLQQAGNFLKDLDRSVREEVFRKLNEVRMSVVPELHSMFTGLIKKRYKLSVNAGYKNYRDFKFDELGRFDYDAQDCSEFHNSIKNHVTPLVLELHSRRKEKLKLDSLRPWDLEVDPDGLPAIHPFSGAEELIDSTIRCFSEVRPDYGTFLQTMDQRGFLDLDSRKGKAPGGFNYPLYESNIPFIFMNSTGNLRDLETMLHEGGHAIHSFLSNQLELVDFKSLSAEIAELASMSMEVIAMDHGADFFEDIEEYRRARRTHLEGIIKILPWIATVDKFQHWVYTHPEHSESERDHAWVEIAREFAGTFIDYSGIEECFTYAWQKQLHLFEVPFYYIEYGIAQLGAIAVWRNYRANSAKTLEQFSKALSLGYSVPIPQVYKTAGIEFNFSGPYIMELIDFVWGELKVLDGLPSS